MAWTIKPACRKFDGFVKSFLSRFVDRIKPQAVIRPASLVAYQTMQTLTGIIVQKKNRRRYSLFLDGCYAFSVSERIAAALHTGETFTSDRLEAIKSEDEKQRAIEKTVSWLAYRPRSRMETKAYLESKEFSFTAVSHALKRMEELGYINDLEFARTWIESRLRLRPRGAFGLRHELSSKGIKKQIIDTALEGFDENAAAMRAVDSRLKRWKNLGPKEMRTKIFGFLKRRGFSFETAEKVIKEIIPLLTTTPLK